MRAESNPLQERRSLLQIYPGVTSIREEIMALMSDLSRKMRVRFDQRARSLGLTRPQWRILNMVIHVEGVTQSFIVQKMEVEHITVSRLVNNLVKMGWVERRPDPTDKRSKLIYPTDKVKPLMNEINEIRKTIEEEVFGVLGDKETLALRRTLHKLNDNFATLDKIGDSTPPE